MRRSNGSVVRSAVALAVMLAVVGTGVVVAATLTKKGGAVGAVYTATTSDIASTTSINYVNVPGMEVTVQVPSSQKALLIITFSAEAYCIDPDDVSQCFVTATVNGFGGPKPSAAIFASAGPETGEHNAQSMQFVAGPFNAGNHVVRIQYAQNSADGTFGLGARTLTVLRSKVV